jgi:hypothetical protein
MNEKGYLDTILAEGAAKAHPLAAKMLAEVKNRVGLG